MAKSKRQYIVTVIILIIALGFGISIGAIAWIIKDTPDITNYKGSNETTLIYSAEGKLLTKLFKENRIYVSLDRMPKNLKNAIIAIEDKNFYVHHGIDFWGIARAFITNILKGRLAQGGSTITQQLARNALLNLNKTFYRKIQEAYLALQFERLYTKPEILEMYFNEIFLGHSAYGVETAAQQYFDKHVWELTLSESALIAGLPKAPNYYSPFNNPEAARKRRNLVLDRMQELGYITKKKAEETKNSEIKLKPSKPDNEETAPYFIRHVRDKLIDRFGAQMVYSGGLKVYTTLDLKMQQKAEKTAKEAFEKKYIPTVERKNSEEKQPQLALVTVEPHSGAIRAMIGGRGNDQFNRATQAVRQPGSAFKPFVYTTAIKQGYSPASIINDMPMLVDNEDKNTSLSIWPTNFQNKYRGYVRIRSALTNSINVAAVKLLKKVGVENTIETAKKMGITTFSTADYEKNHLSLALGGLNRGVKPIEMASAYGVFANQGVRVKPFAINKVLDKRDRVIYKANPEKEIIMEKDTSYIMTSMLQSVIKRGTGWRANLNRPVAGKTGTTNKYTDAWFVGFTPGLVTSVWIGEDNLQSMVYEQKDKNGNYLFSEGNNPRTISSEEAAKLWGSYMKRVVKNRPKISFTVPDNIIKKEIDTVTGKLPNKYTPKTVEDIFRQNNQPREVEKLHGPVETVGICKKSGLLATSSCPEDLVVKYDYLVKDGTRIGPTKISFKEKTKDKKNQQKSKEDIVKGTYIVDTGEPVQKINPQTGIPVKNKNGQVQFEKKPTQKCTLHNKPEENILNNIWNLFKID